MEAASERKRQSILRVELEWIRRGARARSTKQKAHIQRYEELRDRQTPVQDSQVELSSISTRMGKTTVELENICKAYGERKLIDDFSYIFLKGDRVGFIGPNGCGKSTLMKIIAGIIPQDSGQVIIGQTVKMGYYVQEIASEKNEDENEIDLSYMDPNQRVIDYVKGYGRIYSDCGWSHICICFIGAFLISAGKTVQSDWKTVRRGKRKD